MIKKHLKTLIFASIVILLPILVGVAAWENLPEQLPIHWNAAGEVDGWASKGFTVFGIPFILLGLFWLCVVLTAADPKKANHSDKVLNLVFWIVPLLSTLITVISYLYAMEKSVRIELLMPIILGLMFTVIGNYLPKCKQSFTIGIKIPWTLSSEENWNRTHRLAGKAWVAGGIVMMLSALFGRFAVATFFAAALVMVLLPLIYSYILHRKGI